MTRRNYHVGDLVRSSNMGNADPILTIVATKTMRVVVDVPDRDVLYLDVGDPVKIRFETLGGRGSYEGRIARMAYALNPQDRTLRAEIDLANADGRLRPGLIGGITIHLETKENVIAIPRSAIVMHEGEGPAFCYRVVGGRAVRIPIKIGRNDGERIEVLEGLNEGDIIIAKPDAGLRDGQPVTVHRDAPEPTAR